MEKKKPIKIKFSTAVILIITFTVVILGIGIGIIVFNNSKNNENRTSKYVSAEQKENESKITDNLTNVQKQILGVEGEEKKNELEDEKLYSELYKEYEKLPDEEKKKSEVIPRKYDVPFEKLEEIKETLEEDTGKNKTIKEEKEIPEKFNLADKIDIKVENQGRYGLCWDFASVKSLETHLAINGLGNYDLSEMHVNYITSDLMYGGRKIDTGGNFGEFKDYISESGVVLENQVPYKDYTEEEYSKFADIQKVIEVTETVNFPSLYKGEDSKYFEYTNEEITEYRETVKKHILKNGGLYCVIATPDPGTKYLNTSTNAECFLGDWNDLPKGRGMHAVTIVGWDDNYSKDNFKEGMKPKNNGAYIILNSWGTAYGNSGYYYVSYEDKYIESDLCGIASTSIEKSYKINSIKNQAIRDYLKDNYQHLFVNYEGEEYITKNAISSIINLDLSNKNLSSIDGIEIFNNVSNLNLSYNNIKDITPITKLKNVSTINLSNNNIKDVSALSNLNLKNYYVNLDLSDNNIKDITPLSNLNAEFFSLNISNNNITGFEKLENVTNLNISGCNVTDASCFKNFKKLTFLDISNTQGIKGLENLPEGLYDLNLSNCNIDSLVSIEPKKNISSLIITNNNLNTLEGIQDFKNLWTLDISKNPIENWNALKEIERENIEEQYEEGYIYEGYALSIIANNCGISDIKIFNDLKTPVNLDLKENNIKDISEFTYKKIYSIDLSKNKELTGLQSLKNIQTVFLNECGINNLDEISKLDNVYDLSLENNNITDVTKLSYLNKLTNLSLNGNKNLMGSIKNDNLLQVNLSNCDLSNLDVSQSKNIEYLNLNNCNLNNTFNLFNLENLYYISILNNPNFTDIYELVKNVIKKDYISIITDNIDVDNYEKLMQTLKNKLYLQCSKINVNCDLTNEKIINFSKFKNLKRKIMNNIVNKKVNVENGILEKNCYIINVEDTKKDTVKLRFGYYYDEGTNISFKYKKNNDINNQTNIENNTYTIQDDNTLSFTENQIKTAFEDYLELQAGANCGNPLDTLKKKEKINYDSSKYDINTNTGEITTNVKFIDYKNAMLNYVSEDEFEKNWTNKIGLSENIDGYLTCFQGGGGYRTYTINELTKINDTTYSVKTTSIVENDNSTIENNIFTFTIKLLNEKCVIDSFE